MRLGSYEILSALGAGGMGEVYRARDTKLDRAVAIKILPEAFASDTERIARFEREAKTLASLNHLNIAHIHGLEESNGVRALVMELVEGEDLAQRLARGAIPVAEALPIAKQIAEALEAAHEQAIIHRDLKPANIKVRRDGTVKVLDFGLAKAMEPASAQGASAQQVHASMSPTITTPAMTQAGMIPTTGNDVMAIELDATRRVTPLVQSPFIERNGTVSPDGRWLAYEANDSGRFEIYVRPFPEVNSGRWQVSTTGGTRPIWTGSGQELVYVSPTGALMGVGVTRGLSWTATTPTLVVKEGYFTNLSWWGRSYDVSSDGQRFLMIKEGGADGTAAPTSIIVVQHWVEELKRLVPMK
jgi:serine/threonine protein kinase